MRTVWPSEAPLKSAVSISIFAPLTISRPNVSCAFASHDDNFVVQMDQSDADLNTVVLPLCPTRTLPRTSFTPSPQPAA